MTDDHDRLADESVDRLERLHEQLSATAERPIASDVSAWLGEAEAVVADVATDPAAPPSAVQRRLEQAQELLANVEETGDPVADEHVAEARELVSALLAELSERED